MADMHIERLSDAQLKAALDALATCGRWTADVDDYPGCMIDKDIAAGKAWGLIDGEGLAVYGVLEAGADEEYARAPGFDAGVPAATIHRLFTAGRAQGRGMGTLMMRMLMDKARDMGARRVYIDVYGGAPALFRFYARLGFERAGAFKRWEPDGCFTLLKKEI